MNSDEIISPQSNLTSSDNLPNCQWLINLTNCKDIKYFRIIYEISAYLALFIFLCSIWLLAWKLFCNSKPKFFTPGGFLAVEGFLFTQILWSGSRIAISIILLYDLFQSQWFIRSLVDNISWYFGAISVATYLACVLRTIPRLHFYRQNPVYQHTLHLPKLRAITTGYLFFTCGFLCFVLVTSILIGHILMERQNLKSKPGKKSDSHLDEYIDILYGLHYGAFGIFCFVCIFGFTVYGKKLTEIVSEGSQMLKATTVYSSENGYRKGNGSTWRFSEFGSRGKELEVKHRGLKRSVMKIKLIHHIFTIIFFLMGVQLISFACFHDRIMSNLFLSMSYAINALLALLVLDAIILITIASSCVNAFVKTRAKTDNDNSVDLPTSAQISIPLLKLPPAAAIPLQRARESITMSIIQLERGDTGGNRMYV